MNRAKIGVLLAVTVAAALVVVFWDMDAPRGNARSPVLWSSLERDIGPLRRIEPVVEVWEPKHDEPEIDGLLSVEGRCVDVGGNPVSDVLVGVRRMLSPSERRNAAETRSDARGKFLLDLGRDRVKEGVLVAFTSTDHAAQAVAISNTRVRTVRLGDVVLGRGARIFGRVVDVAGMVAPDVRVLWISRSDVGPFVPTGTETTSENGEFRLHPLGIGRVEFFAGRGESLVPVGAFDLLPGELEREITLVLPAMRKLKMRVVARDGGAPPADLVCSSFINPVRGLKVLFDAKEAPARPRWTISIPENWSMPLRIGAPGFITKSIPSVLGSHDAGELALRRGSGSVRVVVENARPGQTVWWGAITRKKSLRLPALEAGRLDGDKVMSIAPTMFSVGPGQRVMIFDADKSRYAVTRQITANDLASASAPVSCSFRPLASLVLRCTDARSAPLPGVRISVVRNPEDSGVIRSIMGDFAISNSGLTPMGRSIAQGVTNAEGVAELSVLDVPLEVRVRGEGLASVAQRFARVPDRPVEFVLTKAASVEVSPARDGFGILRIDGSRVRPLQRSDGVVAASGLTKGEYLVGPLDVLRWARMMHRTRRRSFVGIGGTQLVRISDSDPVVKVALSATDLSTLTIRAARCEKGRALFVDVIPESLGDIPPRSSRGVPEDGVLLWDRLGGGTYRVRLLSGPFGGVLAQRSVSVRPGSQKVVTFAQRVATLRIPFSDSGGSRRVRIVSAGRVVVEQLVTGVDYTVSVPVGDYEIAVTDSNQRVQRVRVSARAGENVVRLSDDPGGESTEEEEEVR